MTQEQDVLWIELFKQGKDDVFEQLAAKYSPMMYSYVKRYHIPHMDVADLLQEFHMVLYAAVKQYDDRKHAKFSTFYYRLLYHHVCQLLRYHSAKKRSYNGVLETEMTFEPDDVVNNYAGVDYEKSVDPLEVLLVKEAVEQVYESFSEREKQVFWALQGKGSALLLDERNAIYRCKKKFLDYFQSK